MTSEQFVYIYCLKDPISLEVRYVGKSVNPDKRFKHHLLNANKRKYHSAQWINSLLLSNLKPIMEILEIANINNWKEKEMFWISNYNNLTNILPGGLKKDNILGYLISRLAEPIHNISSVDGKVVVVSPDDFGATGGDTAGSWADF